jgi:hypothetical protein
MKRFKLQGTVTYDCGASIEVKLKEQGCSYVAKLK